MRDLSKDAYLSIKVSLKSAIDDNEICPPLCPTVAIRLFHDSLKLRQNLYLHSLPHGTLPGMVPPHPGVNFEDSPTESTFGEKLSSNFQYFMGKNGGGDPFIEIYFPSFDELVIYEDTKINLLDAFKMRNNRVLLRSAPVRESGAQSRLRTSKISMKELLEEILQRENTVAGRYNTFSWQVWTEKLRRLPIVQIQDYIYQLVFLLRTYNLSTELELANQSSIVNGTGNNLVKDSLNTGSRHISTGNPLEVFLNVTCSGGGASGISEKKETGSLSLAVSYYWILFSQCEDPLYGSLYSKVLNSFLTLLEVVRI